MSMATEESSNPVRNSRARAIRRANGEDIIEGEETLPKATVSNIPNQPLTKNGYRVALGKAPDRGVMTRALIEAAETTPEVFLAPPERGDTIVPVAHQNGTVHMRIPASQMEKIRNAMIEDGLFVGPTRPDGKKPSGDAPECKR